MQSTDTAYYSTCTLYTVNRHCLLINQECAYSQQAQSFNQHVYAVNKHCLLINIYCAYIPLALPINQHVLCMQSKDTAY
jgi:hypothetical protein